MSASFLKLERKRDKFDTNPKEHCLFYNIYWCDGSLELLQGQHATGLHIDYLQILRTDPKNTFWVHQQHRRHLLLLFYGCTCMDVTAKHSYVKQCSLKTKPNQSGISWNKPALYLYYIPIDFYSKWRMFLFSRYGT